MVLKRFEALPVNVSVLGEELTFPSSKVSVQNRFLKVNISILNPDTLLLLEG